MAATDEALVFAGPRALADLVRRGEVHPRELVELSLRRIEALEPSLNAFRVLLADEAVAAAENASREGILAGVPIAIKGDTPVRGHPTMRGARSYGQPEPQDAEVVRRLRAAGAIPIGITTVPELMIWPWTSSDATGVTHNPWDPSRTTGGSSGGSAAAVAAGMVPCATGSDGGGSIRIPAACCGLVGMKPTRGRVSMQPVGSAWLGLSTFGGLARTVRDSALMLDAMHGTVEGDAYTAPPFDGRYVDAAERPPGRLRIAASRKLPPGIMAKLSADQRGAWEQIAALLRDLGHEVTERDPSYGTGGLVFTQTWVRGVYEESREVPDQSVLERSTRGMMRAGRLVSESRARKLQGEIRARITERVLALWNQVDVLLTPGLATTAIQAEGAHGRGTLTAFNTAARFTPWTAAFNVTGQPAIAIPAGIASDGLPLSVQLVGRIGAENVLYSLAAQIEAARPWADRRPSLALPSVSP